MELLLTCSRKIAKSTDFERQLQIAKSGFDEASFLKLVSKHKVAPLVYMNLRNHAPGTFPANLMQQLEAKYKKNTHSALQAYALIQKIVADNPDVPISIFKGIDSSLRIFGDLAARDVGDIDLLCSHIVAKQLCSYFENSGWELKGNNQKAAFDSKLANINIKDIELLKTGAPRIELHWRLTLNPLEFKKTDISSQTILSKIHPRIRTLSDEFLFVYLCVHGFNHGWERLKWLFDFPEFIESHQLNWCLILEIAEKNGAIIPLRQTLQLCHSLMNVEIPESISSIASKPISNLYWNFVKALVSGEKSFSIDPAPEILIKSGIIKILSCNRITIKFAHLAVFFLPTKHEFGLLCLPPPLRFLYIPLRPLNWIYRRIFKKLS